MLGIGRSLVRNQAQLDEYESFLHDDMATFLLKRTVVLQSQLEDSYWYTDWCNWKKWMLENENQVCRETIEEVTEEIAALKEIPIVRVILKLRSLI